MGLRHHPSARLTPAWRYKADGMIWRVVPERDRLVCEVRDLEKKTTSFSCIAWRDGKVLWEGVTLDEAWWVGIEAVHNGVIFFHKFASPDMPRHKGIIAADLLDGGELWRNEGATFLQAEGNSVSVNLSSMMGHKAVWLDCRTGKETEQSIAEQKPGSQPDEEVGSEFPVAWEHIDADVRESVRIVLPEEFLSAEAVVLGNLVIIGHHEREPKSAKASVTVANVLSVVDLQTGKRMFREKITGNAPAPVPDTFFIRAGFLFYVKDRMELTAIDLGLHNSQ